jgi:hypothetical protein
MIILFCKKKYITDFKICIKTIILDRLDDNNIINDLKLTKLVQIDFRYPIEKINHNNYYLFHLPYTLFLRTNCILNKHAPNIRIIDIDNSTAFYSYNRIMSLYDFVMGHTHNV